MHLLTFDSLEELMPAAARGGLFAPPLPAVRAGAPMGVAYRDSCLYICDTSAGCVQVWDLQHGQARTLGSAGELVKPVAVAADCGGSICVADAGRGQVLVFDANGSLLRSFAPADRASWRPAGLACAGDTVYVADLAGQAVQAWSVRDGQLLHCFGDSTSGPLAHPCGLAFDTAGRLLVAELMSGCVQMLAASGAGAQTIPAEAAFIGSLGRPRAVAIGPDGMVFVADAGFGCIQVFDSEGRLQMRVGPDGVLPLPNGLCIARQVPDGIRALVPKDFAPAYYLWVSNTVNAQGLVLFAVGAFESR